MSKYFGISTFIFLAVISSAAFGQERTHDHTITATGGSEAAATADAQQQIADYVADFIADLEQGDLFIMFSQGPGNWDGTTYTVDITIFWIDRAPTKGSLIHEKNRHRFHPLSKDKIYGLPKLAFECRC